MPMAILGNYTTSGARRQRPPLFPVHIARSASMMLSLPPEPQAKPADYSQREQQRSGGFPGQRKAEAVPRTTASLSKS
jgi:hypothetical protein